MHVNQGEGIHPLLRVKHGMDGVDLHESAWVFWQRTINVWVEALVWAPFLEEPHAVKGALHRGEGDHHAFVLEDAMDDFT